MNVFDRDGHISELTFDRMSVDESFDGRIDAEEHLEACDLCTERWSELKAFDASFDISPPQAETATESSTESVREREIVVSLEERRPKNLAAIALAACALLAVGFWWTTQSERASDLEGPDIVRIKGSQFRMELYINDQTGSRQASDGESVHPGDRVGFKVATTKPGYVLIAGLDQSGSVYPCYPQSGSDAALIDANPDGIDLQAAIELDAVMGEERIVGAFCPNSFTMKQLADRMNGGVSLQTQVPKDPMSGCAFEELTLNKSPK